MARNPFPPPAQLEDPKLGRYELASSARRLTNYLIDWWCLVVLASLLAAIAASALDRDIDTLFDDSNLYLLNVVAVAASVLYYVSCESLAGRTLGKLITGTRLVTVSGGRPTFGQILLRTVIRLIPLEAISFLGKSPVGLHDRWSGTRVVRS